MSIEYRQGDLFESGLPALAHGVNCKGSMGAGIAAGFAQRWPLMYCIYQDTCRSGKLHLGDVLPFEDIWNPPPAPRLIFNLATQDSPGPDARPWAIAMALGQVIRLGLELGVHEVGMPMIGCGIGGLRDEQFVQCLQVYHDAPVGLIVYRYNPR